MKRKFSVIQINGLTGLLLIVFIICCVVAGFILFPSWCCMRAWNFIASYINMPIMQLYHGAMLWAIICLMFFALHKHTNFIRFGSAMPINDEEVKNVLKSIHEDTDNIKINKEN